MSFEWLPPADDNVGDDHDRWEPCGSCVLTRRLGPDRVLTVRRLDTLSVCAELEQ